jgi:radical SAM superfamily enzyme YgiQ (UPF0313 family)
LSVKAICKLATVSQFEGGPQALFERYSRLNGIWFVFSMEDIEDFRKLSLRELFQRFIKSDDSKLHLQGSFMQTKPHSADVERLISCSVLLKSSARSRMLVETENLNLHVHYNMPPMDHWDPKPAVRSWMMKESTALEIVQKENNSNILKEYFLKLQNPRRS